MGDSKAKILFVIPSLVAGGAERVMSFVALNLDRKKFDVELVVVGYEKDTSYDVSGVKTVYLGKSRVLFSILPLYRYIKKSRPDVVISAIGHLNTVTAYLSIVFPRIKFVAREVNILSKLRKYQLKKTGFSKRFSERRFNYFDLVICQSEDMKSDLMATYSIPKGKTVVINNPVTDGFSFKDRTINQDKLNFITVARLKEQKGHARIIKALSELENDFQYTMVGDGPERENLMALAQELGILDKVVHVPYTNKVQHYLAESDLYLQASYIEGFPNAVIESCAVGTPVLAIEAPGGINEIIMNGVNGYVTENLEDYISAIKQIQKEYPFKRTEVSKVVFDKFNKSKIVGQYESSIINLMEIHGKA